MLALSILTLACAAAASAKVNNADVLKELGVKIESEGKADI